MNAKTFALSLICAAAMIACADKDSRPISEVPPPGTSTLLPVQKVSSLTADIAVPFAKLAEVAGARAPSAFSKSGRQTSCKRIGPKGNYPWGGSWDLSKEVCADVDYEVTAQRGPITITQGAQPNSIRVAVPVQFSGWAGATGDVARLLALHRKNFGGAVDAWVDLQVDIGSDWCPRIDGAADFRWTTPAKVEVFGGVWVPIDSMVEGELRSRLGELNAALQGAIDCSAIRGEVAKLWASRSTPVSIADARTAYVNLEPVALGVSSLRTNAQRLELTVQAKGKVSVSDAAASSRGLPLPELQRVGSEPGRISLSVPLSVGYSSINQELATSLNGKAFGGETGAGKVTVTVGKVVVYPSNRNVVVGISFSADVPGRLLDVKGDVYLQGQPAIDATGRVVSIEDLRFSRVLDNEFWNAVSAIFEGDIRRLISEKAKVDIGAALDQAKPVIEKSLAQLHAQSGVRVDLSEPRLAVRQIVPAHEKFVVEAAFEAGVRVDLSGAVVSQP